MLSLSSWTIVEPNLILPLVVFIGILMGFMTLWVLFDVIKRLLLLFDVIARVTDARGKLKFCAPPPKKKS